MIMQANYYRPATRGELRDKLAEGISCEVASYVSEMTGHMLRGWLHFDNFITRPSENDDWTIFEYKTP